MLGDKANDIISSSFNSYELPIDASVRPVPYYQYNITTLQKRINIMAKMSVIPYNCKGFNVSKVPCIKILLDRCSVLLLQETWLFSNKCTQLTKYFDKYKSINICGMDESIFCHGRPHGGCSILYSNQYDVTPLYFKEERRIVGIKISLCNGIFHVFNVHMPSDDHSTDAYDMYKQVVNTVSLYCTNNNVDTYVFRGDFNTALNRETSCCTIALNTFVYE